MRRSAPSDEDARRQAEKKKQAEADFTWLMGDPRGRRLMYGLIRDAGVFHSTYNPMAREVSLDMAFAEGRKNVGYYLLDRINRFTPGEFMKMMQENTDE